MPLPSLREVQGLPDPAASWLWTMDIMLPDNRAISHLYVMEVNFPFTYIDAISRYRAGSFLYFPGHSNIDQVTVSFYETTDMRILQTLKLWQGLVIDSDGNYSAPFQYLGTAILHLFDYQGNERASCNLSGCWPARLSDWQLSYQASGHLQVQVTFSVNSSNFVFFNNGGGQLGNNVALDSIMPRITPPIINSGGLDTVLPQQSFTGGQANPIRSNSRIGALDL